MSSEVVTPLLSAFIASVLTIIGSRWVMGVQMRKAGEHQRVQARP